MNVTSFFEAAAACTVVLTGICTLAYFIWRKAVRPAWHQFSQLLADWHGSPERPGVPARPGVLARLAAMDERLASVEGQLTRNGGSSMRDAVDRVENKLGTNETAARTYRDDHP